MESPNESVADLSSLTRVQVETLKSHLAVRKGEINMVAALRTRKNIGISRGTHYRVLAQAKTNIRRSLVTVAIATQLGLVKPDDVQKLVAMVSRIPPDIDPEMLPEVVTLVKALLSRIVML